MMEKVKTALSIIFQGKVLLVIGADKLLGHIIFAFIMAIGFIGITLGIEATVHQKEENKAKLENIRSLYTEKECELTSLNSICKVQDMLQEMGSELKIPHKKAKVIR